MRLSVLGLGWILSLLGACATSGSALPPPEMSEDGSWGNKGTVVPLDDVTNGLQGNPSYGAFFNDGDGGDAMARTENVFAVGRESAGEGVATHAPRRDRMLIHTGELSVEVPRAEEAGKQFLAQVEAWGGYLQSQSGTTLTVRVPAERFEEAFAAVRAAGRVLSEKRRANDVTEEFVDLGIRVDNARKSRDRLLQILEKAEQVEDILKIERELRRLTEEIERMEGRLKYLRDQVAMSTLRASFRSVRQAPPPKRQRRWSRFGWINRVGANAVMGAF